MATHPANLIINPSPGVARRAGIAAQQDEAGLEWSGASSAAAEIYARALRAFNGYRGDPVEIIDRALPDAPHFVMGHVLRGAMHMALWERSAVAGVERSIAAIESCPRQPNEREAQYLGILRHWAAGRWDAARHALDRLSAAFPRDLLALQLGHLCDFFHGDRDNLRARIARTLPHWSRADDGYAYVLGMHAFGLEECGQFGQAEDTGRYALELEPNDCWAHHAVTHVMEMQGRQAEGIAFMRDRERWWAQPDNAFQYHNWWHLALFHLDQGEPDAALDIYDGGIRGEGLDVQMLLLDATALLWRLHLERIDVGSRWHELGERYRADSEAGFYAFNDMHAVMALIACGDPAAASARAAAAMASADADTTNAQMLQGGANGVLAGFAAFGRGDYVGTINSLLPARFRACIFGGSHAQRDVIHRTLIEAALRAGDRALAATLTAERVALKPQCPYSRRLAARAHATP